VNIGPNPTFSDLSPKVEIHLLQWQGELYGQTLHCDLIAKIRSIKKFETVEALLNQIEADIQQIVQRVALPQPEHSR
jgi:riboflavin kinase / FMN adenylyltransferase